mmetsp:Transcript_4203/g.9021  ORF Transcript_4203/g.9021 Transcript_4203/m.9021 type:complete len:232 (+) Transcript_4203:22-717(+)
MWFSVADVGTLALAAAAAAAVLRPTPSMAVMPANATHAMIAALLISSSHVLYALVWYFPQSFMKMCKTLGAGINPVTAFSGLVALAKVTQQIGLIGWVCTLAKPDSAQAAVRFLLASISEAAVQQWVLAGLLIAAGQALNLSIYRAIGKDGVYYGFKLGHPVPWCTDFPFNAGFRHPQYVGGMLSQLGVFSLLATSVTLNAGLLAFLAYWFALYAITSYMEASGDNDEHKD